MEEGKVLHLRQYGQGGWEETRGKIYKAIMAGVEFESGKMTGTKVTKEMIHKFPRGQLPVDWAWILVSDQPDYAVYSYGTPIAWHVPDDGDDGGERWVVPKVRYSPTTSHHQNLVRTALVFNRTEPLEELSDAQRGHK